VQIDENVDNRGIPAGDAAIVTPRKGWTSIDYLEPK
jgi:hypothetical protein